MPKTVTTKSFDFRFFGNSPGDTLIRLGTAPRYLHTSGKLTALDMGSFGRKSRKRVKGQSGYYDSCHPPA